MPNDPKIPAAQPGAPPQVTSVVQPGANVPPAPTVVPQVPAPAPTPPPAPLQPQPPAVGQPAGTPAEDYVKKFKGLQAVHQNLAEEHKTLRATHEALSTQVTELQTTLEATRAQLKSLETDKGTSDSAASLAQEELADYKLWERKLIAIRTQAPNLLPFEKNIVIEIPAELESSDPSTMTEDQLKILDDALTASITEFGTAMAGYVKDLQVAQHAGVVPTSSPGRGGEEITMEQLYDLAIAKAGTPEGDQIMAQYAKLAEKNEQVGRVDGEGYWRPPS